MSKLILFCLFPFILGLDEKRFMSELNELSKLQDKVEYYTPLRTTQEKKHTNQKKERMRPFDKSQIVDLYDQVGGESTDQIKSKIAAPVRENSRATKSQKVKSRGR